MGRDEVERHIARGHEVDELGDPARGGGGRTSDTQPGVHRLDGPGRDLVETEVLGCAGSEHLEVRLVPDLEAPRRHLVTAVPLDQVAGQALDQRRPNGPSRAAARRWRRSRTPGRRISRQVTGYERHLDERGTRCRGPGHTGGRWRRNRTAACHRSSGTRRGRRGGWREPARRGRRASSTARRSASAKSAPMGSPPVVPSSEFGTAVPIRRSTTGGAGRRAAVERPRRSSPSPAGPCPMPPRPGRTAGPAGDRDSTWRPPHTGMGCRVRRWCRRTGRAARPAIESPLPVEGDEGAVDVCAVYDIADGLVHRRPRQRDVTAAAGGGERRRSDRPPATWSRRPGRSAVRSAAPSRSGRTRSWRPTWR